MMKMEMETDNMKANSKGFSLAGQFAGGMGQEFQPHHRTAQMCCSREPSLPLSSSLLRVLHGVNMSRVP